MGYAQWLKGTIAKANCGMLRTDWWACGDIAANVTRLIGLAKGERNWDPDPTDRFHTISSYLQHFQSDW